jgi:KDO2-lipid IV(A) lauroyltransferase
MTGRLVDFGYAAGWRLVRGLPAGLAARMFTAAADTAWRRDGPAVRQLARNLQRVIGAPPPAALVRQALRSYARYWLEAFRLPTLSQRQILDTFHLPQRDLLARHLDQGQGVVAALPHMGNWDHAGAWATANGWPLTTVAERLRPESLFERFVAYRRTLGMEILPLTGGAQPPLDVLTERVRAGAVVPLLADRDLSSRGVPVTFFGDRTRMPAGPALLAIRTGAPLLVASIWYEDGRTCARLDEVALATSGNRSEQVAVTTQRIADLMAARIAEHPADWHMLQRLWLADVAARAREPVQAESDG